MTRMNWERAAEQEKYRRIPHDNITRASKPERISNAQKKLISTMLKERGMEWDSEINSLSRKEASDFISELRKVNIQ